LRALAFGRPLVVLGERGFSEVFEPDTAGTFLWQGFYGLGDGSPSPAPLAAQLRGLLASEAWRQELGRYARQVVADRFGLDAAAATVEELYRRVREPVPSSAVVLRDGLRTAGIRWGVTAIPEPVKHAVRRTGRFA
jgi:glycosyltransferase involved in cell wall biosynthesis